VFKLPRDNKTDYVKRIIGMPGETILLRDGVVYIDDIEVRRREVEDYEFRRPSGIVNVSQYEETLPNGRTYRVLDAEKNGPLDNVGPFKVPQDHYFVLGDNRDNSADSRDRYGVGYVPFVNLVGRVDVVFMSVSDDGSSRAGRMGTRVR
jgi:signal peptidase I